jgi:hypothetical protein
MKGIIKIYIFLKIFNCFIIICVSLISTIKVKGCIDDMQPVKHFDCFTVLTCIKLIFICSNLLYTVA